MSTSFESALDSMKTSVLSAYDKVVETHLPTLGETLTQWATATYGNATKDLPKFFAALAKMNASWLFPSYAFLKKHANAIAFLFFALVALSLLIECVRERSCPAAPPAPSPSTAQANVAASPLGSKPPQSSTKPTAVSTPRAVQPLPAVPATSSSPLPPAVETPKVKAAVAEASEPQNFATGP